MVKQAWRGLTRPLRLIRFAEVRLWLVLAVVVSAFVFLFVLALARYRVFRRQMNLLKNMPKDSGRYIASGISKVLAVLRNPMDPAVVMYEGFNGYAQLTSQEGIFHFWIGMQPFVVLHAAHTIEPLLTSTVNISKTGQYQFLGPVLGEGLLTSTGNKWRSRRKLLTPAFHFRVLDSCVGIFNEQARVLLQKIRDSSQLDFVDLFPMMTHCTLDVLCESSMGIHLGAQGTTQHSYVKNLHTLLNCGMERLSKPWLWWNTVYNLSSQKRKFTKAAKDLNNFVNEVIRKRKEILRQKENGDRKNQNSKYSNAFLDVLLKHHMEDSTLSEQDIIEEVNTFLFAGHETTAVGLTYLLYILGLHQDVQDKVVDEIYSIFHENLERDVTREDASLMKYLECVIKESQRIFTILPIYGRKVQEDFNVGFFRRTQRAGIHTPLFLSPPVQETVLVRSLPSQKKKVIVATVLRHFRIMSLDHRDRLILSPQPILHPRSVFGGIRVKFIPRRPLRLQNA
ncbi:hypothetical protein MRX96_042358 [Rhipicephalus microplus]